MKKGECISAGAFTGTLYVMLTKVKGQKAAIATLCVLCGQDTT